MTADNPIWQALRRISERADMLAAADRELLRPAFAALEGGSVMHVPDYVAKRIRDIDARMPGRARNSFPSNPKEFVCSPSKIA